MKLKKKKEVNYRLLYSDPVLMIEYNNYKEAWARVSGS